MTTVKPFGFWVLRPPVIVALCSPCIHTSHLGKDAKQTELKLYFCIYRQASISRNVHGSINRETHTHTHLCIYVGTSLFTCEHMQRYTRMFAYVCICVRMYMYIHTLPHISPTKSCPACQKDSAERFLPHAVALESAQESGVGFA